jgi:bifunctional DNA-binding transcriptional regulator/antitoxin component of YhaV-PrlF toxin-antitoxin module
MSQPDRTDLDAVVSASGDVVIPSDRLRRLSLSPGQQVRVTVTARPRRQNMRGVLAGRLPDVDPEEIARVRREIWADLAGEQ